MQIHSFSFTPVSMLTRENPQLQRVELDFDATQAGHIRLEVRQGKRSLEAQDIAILSGRYRTNVLLPPPKSSVETVAEVRSREGDLLASTTLTWKPPRQWTFYVMLSSHTDIGLHNSQYIQRHNSADFLDKAVELVDQTADWPEESRYHYCMEGTWVWENYALERNQESAERIARDYIRPGKIGLGAGLAGNCTQLYGNEELCRATYLRKSLKEKWRISCETMTMMDMNGISWGLVEPYAKAGYKNIFWAPNPWNPLQTTLYTRDMDVLEGTFTPDSCASGSRCDVRYDSALPMVFYWQGADNHSRLLVWASTSYAHGGSRFGLSTYFTWDRATLRYTESEIVRQLQKLEARYPYDVWLLACYRDDEEPNLTIADRIREWNDKWAWPKIQMTGNLDTPFNLLRKRFGKVIPTLRGEITGGWYQLALSAPELLARKFAADRALPTAEKIATIAAFLKTGYTYPKLAFQRAWYALICNDEHSYGCSGYQGRRVYETWMQHRAWIEQAEETARRESAAAMEALASAVQCDEPSMLVFNPTMSTRIELVEYTEADGRLREQIAMVPPLGYIQIPLQDFKRREIQRTESTKPPQVASPHYRVKFGTDGSIVSILDIIHGEELLEDDGFSANQLLYTNDNHRNYHTPKQAQFVIEKSNYLTRVIVHSTLEELGAEIIQTITLPRHSPRIDLETKVLHAKDMVNSDRYHRYLYIAFPFEVPDAKRYVKLNGCIAEFGKDLTGHGTDTYMAARDTVFIENGETNIAFTQLDTSLVEFGRIHKDKTDFGDDDGSSRLFSYVANDWLQMHTTGGSHLDFQFRYSIMTYEGGYRKNNNALIGEELTTPCLQCLVSPHEGFLPADQHWAAPNTLSLQLLAIKCADDNRGIIFRLQEQAGKNSELVDDFLQYTNYAIHEGEPISRKVAFAPFETKTLKLTAPPMPLRDEEPHYRTDGIPEDIGRVYTGLIDRPRAACGAEDGQLYLLWGQNPEPDVQSYELYRSKDRDFTPSKETFVAEVPRGEYCVARYEDRGLESHTLYYYRLRAVSTTGARGAFSEVFCGITREMR